MPSLASIRRAVYAFLVRRQNRVEAPVSLDELTRQHLELTRLIKHVKETADGALTIAQNAHRRLEYHEEGPLGPSAAAYQEGYVRGVIRPDAPFNGKRIVLLDDDARSH